MCSWQILATYKYVGSLLKLTKHNEQNNIVDTVLFIFTVPHYFHWKVRGNCSAISLNQDLVNRYNRLRAAIKQLKFCNWKYITVIFVSRRILRLEEVNFNNYQRGRRVQIFPRNAIRNESAATDTNKLQSWVQSEVRDYTGGDWNRSHVRLKAWGEHEFYHVCWTPLNLYGVFTSSNCWSYFCDESKCDEQRTHSQVHHK